MRKLMFSRLCSLLVTEPECKFRSSWLSCFLSVFQHTAFWVWKITQLYTPLIYSMDRFDSVSKFKNPEVKKDFNGSYVSRPTKIILLKTCIPKFAMSLLTISSNYCFHEILLFNKNFPSPFKLSFGTIWRLDLHIVSFCQLQIDVRTIEQRVRF